MVFMFFFFTASTNNPFLVKTYWYVRFYAFDIINDFMFYVGAASSVIYYSFLKCIRLEDFKLQNSTTNNLYKEVRGVSLENSNYINNNKTFLEKSNIVIDVFDLKKSIDLSKYGTSTPALIVSNNSYLGFSNKINYLHLESLNKKTRKDFYQINQLDNEFYTTSLPSLNILNTDYMVLDSGSINSNLSNDLGLSNQVNQVSKSTDSAKQDRWLLRNSFSSRNLSYYYNYITNSKKMIGNPLMSSGVSNSNI